MSGAPQPGPSTVADRLARLAQQNGIQTGYVPPPPSGMPVFPVQPTVAPSGWDSPALAAPTAYQPPVPSAPQFAAPMLPAPHYGGQDPHHPATAYASAPPPYYPPVSYAPPTAAPTYAHPVDPYGTPEPYAAPAVTAANVAVPAPYASAPQYASDPYGTAPTPPYAADPYAVAPQYAPAPAAVSYAPYPQAVPVPPTYVPSVAAAPISPLSSGTSLASHAVDTNAVATHFGVPTVTAQIVHQHPMPGADVPEPLAQPHGYSDRATGRALINDDTPKPSWRISDDAPRYQPPGTVETDQDPFGLGALPQHVVYNGPRDLPNDTTLGFLLGLLSFVFFPFAFFGLRCTRRGRKMIAAAPNRYRGKMLSVFALVLCIVGPICSLAVGAHYLGYLPKF
jgi:hypothetical protein